MKPLLTQIRELIEAKDYLFSLHAVQELANDNIAMDSAVAHPESWIIVEEYPDAFKGPCVLVLCCSPSGDPLHLLWGIPVGQSRPAVLVTAYRPDPVKWEWDFLKRKAQ